MKVQPDIYHVTVDTQAGDGKTTKQMLAAPQGAVFIWCDYILSYPRDLAQDLGRPDLKIVGPAWLTHQHFRNHAIRAIVVDHAFRFTERSREDLGHALSRVRPS